MRSGGLHLLAGILLGLHGGSALALEPAPAQDASRAAPATEQSARELNTLGIQLAGAGKLEEALGKFRQAADLSPRSGDIQYNLAVTYQKLGQLSPALEAFHAAITAAPANPAIHLGYG